jgi:hypothetical protein
VKITGMRALASLSFAVFVAVALALGVADAVYAQQSSTAKPHPGTAATPSGTPAATSSTPIPHTGMPAKQASGAAASSTVSASFTISQLGHSVGSAEFHLARSSKGIDSMSTVNVSMKGLDYALSKTELLDATRQIIHEQLSATVNGSAVNVTGKPDSTQFLLNISANGRSSTTRLAGHNGAVFLPDFDPGALQILLKLAAEQNNRDLWVILPKQAGSVQPVELATYPDEQGTLDGKPVVAHHLVATIAGSETDLFAGADNQLLQAELPQQGFSLVRKGFVLTPPRKPVAPAAP